MRPTGFQPLTVVITGATRGLGRAMVAEFGRLGHNVFGCARTRNDIEELACEYPKHDFQAVDVASNAQVKTWADRILLKGEPPAFVLNNAAVLNSKAPLWEVGDREFSDTIDINIKGVVNVIRHFVPSMISRKRGVIVNFSSRWGRKCEKRMAPYCATKWAVVALTRALAEELRPMGVAVIALNPGTVMTGMFKKYLSDVTTPDKANSLTPIEWAGIAAPFILGLGLKDTGKLRAVLNSSQFRTYGGGSRYSETR